MAPCRSCGSTELTPILSLGRLPLADGLLTPEQLARPEPRYALDLVLCTSCGLVQILETVPPDELFGADYPYFSSFSETLLQHSQRNVEQRIAERAFGPNSLVVELASNDGYLLQYYRQHDIPVLGIDPAPAPVAAALASGVPTTSWRLSSRPGAVRPT
jgi:Putative zinc binding domain